MSEAQAQYPCHSEDWNPGEETIFDYIERVRDEKKWLTIVYELPGARIGEWPLLRVDEDSVVIEMSQKFSLLKSPRVDLCYCASARHHELLIRQFRKQGIYSEEFAAQLMEKLKKVLDAASNRG